MGTKKTTTDAKGTKDAKKAKGLRHSTTLTDPSGAQLNMVAAELKDGRFRSAVIHRVVETVEGKAKFVGVRSMDEIHATFEAAKGRAARLVTEAAGLGWTVKPLKAKAEKVPAFVTIPKPNMAKPTAPVAPKTIKPIRHNANA